MTVPLLWHPAPTSAEDTLTLERAASFGPEWELRFSRTEKPSNTATAFAWQQNTLSVLHTNPFNHDHAFSLRTNVGNAFCIGSDEEEAAVSFICRVVSTDWEIRYLGNESAGLAARTIVSSLR